MIGQPEIGASSTQVLLREAAYKVVGLTLDNLTAHGRAAYEGRAFQDERQAEGDYSNTFYHESEVGALVLLATGNEMVAIGAATHDSGKGEECVRNVMTQPRRLNEAEWRTMKAHASYGATILRSAFADPHLESMARQIAGLHHNPRPDFFVNAREREVWDGVTVTAIADRSQAVLLDWRRTYKADRMAHEGLITSDGKLVMDKVVEDILGDDAGRTYMGTPAEDILDLAVACMPPQEYIQERLTRGLATARL